MLGFGGRRPTTRCAAAKPVEVRHSPATVTIARPSCDGSPVADRAVAAPPSRERVGTACDRPAEAAPPRRPEARRRAPESPDTPETTHGCPSSLPASLALLAVLALVARLRRGRLRRPGRPVPGRPRRSPRPPRRRPRTATAARPSPSPSPTTRAPRSRSRPSRRRSSSLTPATTETLFALGAGSTRRRQGRGRRRLPARGRARSPIVATFAGVDVEKIVAAGRRPRRLRRRRPQPGPDAVEQLRRAGHPGRRQLPDDDRPGARRTSTRSGRPSAPRRPRRPVADDDRRPSSTSSPRRVASATQQAADVLRDRHHERHLHARRPTRSTAEMFELAGGDPISSGTRAISDLAREARRRRPAGHPARRRGVRRDAPSVAERPGWGDMTAVKNGAIRADRRHHRDPARARGSSTGSRRSIAAIHPGARGCAPARRPRLRRRPVDGAERSHDDDPAVAARAPGRLAVGRRARAAGPHRLARRRPGVVSLLVVLVGGVAARVGRRRARRHARDPRAPAPRARLAIDLDAGRRDDRRGPAPAARPDGDDRRAPGSPSPAPRSRACCATRWPTRTCSARRPGRRSGRRSRCSSRSATRRPRVRAAPRARVRRRARCGVPRLPPVPRRAGTAPMTSLLLTGYAVGSLLAAGLAMAMYLSGAGLRQIFSYLLGGFDGASWVRLAAAAAARSSAASALILLRARVAQRVPAGRGGGRAPRRRRPARAGDPARPRVAGDGRGGRRRRADRLRRARRRRTSCASLVGPNARLVLPLAALFGAILLAAADLVARLLGEHPGRRRDRGHRRAVLPLPPAPNPRRVRAVSRRRSPRARPSPTAGPAARPPRRRPARRGRASASPSSGRTAPASRRCCGPSPGSSSRPPAAVELDGAPLAGLDRRGVARRLAVVPQLPALPFATHGRGGRRARPAAARAPDPRPAAGRPRRRSPPRSTASGVGPPAGPRRPRAVARRAPARPARDGRRAGARRSSSSTSRRSTSTSATRSRSMELLADLNERDGTTIVAVLHDLGLAAHFFPRSCSSTMAGSWPTAPPRGGAQPTTNPRGLRGRPGARSPGRLIRPALGRLPRADSRAFAAASRRRGRTVAGPGRRRESASI